MKPVTLRERLAKARAVLAEQPPQQLAARAARVVWRTGIVRGARPLAFARIAAQRGLGIRSLHAVVAAAHPERVAVIDRRRQLSYRKLDEAIDAFGHALVAGGRGPVGLLLENRSEYLVAWMALARLGLVCGHLGTSATADELAPLLSRTGITRVVVSATTRPRMQEVVERHPELNLTLFDVDADRPTEPHAQSLWSLVERHRGKGPARFGSSSSAEAAASVVYTSGTTGRPKAAMRDLSSVGVLELLSILDGLPMRAGDHHLVVAPLYHSGAQVFTLIATALASTLVLHERFDATEVATTLSRSPIHSTFMVPTMLQRVLDLPASVHAELPTPQLHAIVCGAAPFSVDLRRRAIARYGADAIFDFYGATELGWVTLVGGHDMLRKPGTLGPAIAGQQIRVVDAQGRSLPAGEVGRIYTSGAQQMNGYLGDERATAEIREGAWATVDDLGYLDDDGYLFLTGRARDMVISGGVNVYPVEIENVLSQHPAIAEVAVIGLPHPEWGEQVTAVFAAAAGHAVEIAQLDAWVRPRLAKAKRPRRWECVDRLPRNPTGKVLKRTLVERYH